MSNNLGQIVRQVSGGGVDGHDRVRVATTPMVISAGLERLRHATLERGADGDR